MPENKKKNADNENEKVVEVNKFAIALMALVIVFIIGGGMYLLFGSDNDDELDEEEKEGSTVSLSVDNQKYLKTFAESLIVEAGDFGLDQEKLSPDAINTVIENSYSEAPLFDEYFTTREEKYKKLKEENLIYSGGKADLNTSRWDFNSEAVFYTSYKVDSVVANVPKYAQKGTLTLVEVPVRYDNTITIGNSLESEAPKKGEKARIGIQTGKYTFTNNSAVLTFVQVGNDWQLYDFKSKKDPYGLVFWVKPDMSKIMESVDKWGEGEVFEAK